MKCPECKSKDITSEVREDYCGPETVHTCQACKCKFYERNMIIVHGNTKEGAAMTLAEYMATGYINLEYMIKLVDNFEKARR